MICDFQGHFFVKTEDKSGRLIFSNTDEINLKSNNGLRRFYYRCWNIKN